jgi:hypothetical protein
MTARLDYGWRLFATGMSFVVFGICGLLFSILAYPLACLWPHAASRQRAVTTLIHWFFRALVAALQWTGVMELDLQGIARLRASGPAIVVANHPTYLDVMVLLALTPSACCVVKSAHWGNPCFWGIVRAAAYVSNADPVEFVEDCSRRGHAQSCAEPVARILTRLCLYRAERGGADCPGPDELRSSGFYQGDALVPRSGAPVPDQCERARSGRGRTARHSRCTTGPRGTQRDERYREAHHPAPVRIWIL